MDHITIYERVYFDENGNATGWERSLDRKTWEPVEYYGDKLPFVLLKPINLPGMVEREIWEEKGRDERP